ncbi:MULTISPECIES: imelysin family protein [Marinobacter]|uniref:imelysin family protein n=1 Tax=Marinobacter TaxID=2742 RepID=UPI0003B81681|nr:MULTISPECIES: imelysin family protein [Marinobacter]ERP89913.1 peptidase [Marinobacter sp. ES-1]MBN8238768.1 peptidase [Marinobacter nauticus]MBY5937866.1 peptidase [Marinobacter nauticus]MBY5955094.1 peptidase [Marinobacter nauticus]MBY6008887.1 peptidase [Marinobacter nauticus]
MKNLFRPAPLALTIATALTAGCANAPWSAEHSAPATKASVVTHYADLAHATYEDALITARALDEATDRLIANPTEANLKAAKEAWLASRVPYQQSEVFRFGNAIVDDWEGQLNAWPLDEGLIDYVKADDYQHELGNAGATANIVASNSINVGGETLDVATLTPELLADLNEVGGSEANVATGYHAVEFLLWGQDLHGFEGGAGERPVTDYAKGNDCTNGNCERRAQYLDAVTDLLVDDLEWMVAQWAPGTSDNYRSQLTSANADEGIQKMLFGMGSLSLGELAGERMKVALEANSYEDEHDCFSDNTHNSHYYNGQGIQNVYTGTYRRVDGSVVSGPSLSDLVEQTNPELDARLNRQLDASMEALALMKARAESSQNPMAFDTMIAPGNAEGTRIVNGAIMALVEQTGSIEQAARQLGIQALSPDDAGHSF